VENEKLDVEKINSNSGALVDTIKAAFNTGGAARTTETTSRTNNRTVVITAQPVVAIRA
jgi:hypothetical protein